MGSKIGYPRKNWTECHHFDPLQFTYNNVGADCIYGQTHIRPPSTPTWVHEQAWTCWNGIFQNTDLGFSKQLYLMVYSQYCITLPPSEFTKPSGKPSIFGSFRKEIARFSISSRWSARKDGGNRRERDGNSLGAYSPLAALGNLGSPWQWG